MAKYTVEARPSSYGGSAVRVHKHRRFLPDKFIASTIVSGKPIPVPKGADPYVVYLGTEPPTPAQIEEAALRIVANYEFPKPDIHWCKQL